MWELRSELDLAELLHSRYVIFDGISDGSNFTKDECFNGYEVHGCVSVEDMLRLAANLSSEEAEIFAVFIISVDDANKWVSNQQMHSIISQLTFTWIVWVGDSPVEGEPVLLSDQLYSRTSSFASAVLLIRFLCALLIRTGPVCVDLADVNFGLRRASLETKCFHSSIFKANDSNIQNDLGIDLRRFKLMAPTRTVKSCLAVIKTGSKVGMSQWVNLLEEFMSLHFTNESTCLSWGVVYDPFLTELEMGIAAYFTDG